MVEFLATSGGQLPQEAIQDLETARDLKGIAAVHGQLTRLVAPATPNGIALMREINGQGFSILGPIPLVRGMMLFAVLCLATYFTINISEDDIGVREEAKVTQPQARGDGEREVDAAAAGAAAGLVEGAKAGEAAGAKAGAQQGAQAGKESSWWFDKLPDVKAFEIMLLALAGLGASFASLFEINKHLIQRNFDRGSQNSYWLKCFLGLIAGFILATLIPFSEKAGDDFSQPLLALLGGFSGSAVHRILIRLVEALESLVKGSSQEMVEAHERAMKARSAEELLQQRSKLAVSVIQLRQKIAGRADAGEVDAALDSLLGTLVSPDGSMKVRAMPVDRVAANLQAAAQPAAETRDAAPPREPPSGTGSASSTLPSEKETKA